MSESETEDQILDRIEEALRKIAGAAQHPLAPESVPMPMPMPMSVPMPAPVEDGLDREALALALDAVIARLRGVVPPQQPPTTE